MKKNLQELTIKDNFMFGAVMLDERNCRPFLEMALGIPIDKITVDKEKSLVYRPEYKGVRLDVIAKDEKGTRFNVEMQVLRKKAQDKRSRYYHSQIDMDLLLSGMDYAELPDTYVIFICDFDPCGLEKYRYTFTNRCKEAEELQLRDGKTTVYLSTCGKNRDSVPEALVNFLDYVKANLQESETDFEDAFVKQLQNAVTQVKISREMGARYMIFQEMLQDERAAGKAEGLAIGKTEGLAAGIALGLAAGQQVIFKLLARFDHIPEEVTEAVKSVDDFDMQERMTLKAAEAISLEEFVSWCRSEGLIS